MTVLASNLSPKVFGIGLSRTGTTSLNAALNVLGVRTIHWRVDDRIADISDCYLHDGLTDINAASMFEVLHYTFPNSLFVYTVRPANEWAQSIATHYRANTPKELAKTLGTLPVGRGDDRPEPQRIFYHAMHHALYTQHDSWEAAYAFHDERVSRFFRDKPGKMLTFDIFSAGHAWPELCSFLDRDVPAQPYPKEAWLGGAPVERSSSDSERDA